MSFSCSSETPPILSNAETDGEVARPWPEYGGIRERHVKILTTTSQVGVPYGLGRDGKGKKKYTYSDHELG
jgi:hypothetical protein